MKLPIKDNKGNNQGELETRFTLIENGKGTQAVHDTVVAFQAAQRMGTACTKNVGEVAGTNKKPWRQKGTGRARAGSFQSPLWRGGGVVFGPKPRDFRKKISRATKQLALRKALSERLSAEDERFCGSAGRIEAGRHSADCGAELRQEFAPGVAQCAECRIDDERRAE